MRETYMLFPCLNILLYVCVQVLELETALAEEKEGAHLARLRLRIARASRQSAATDTSDENTPPQLRARGPLHTIASTGPSKVCCSHTTGRTCGFQCIRQPGAFNSPSHCLDRPVLGQSARILLPILKLQDTRQYPNDDGRIHPDSIISKALTYDEALACNNNVLTPMGSLLSFRPLR